MIDSQIQVYKGRVDTSIGSKTAPQSIPPTILAEKIKDLADIISERAAPVSNENVLLDTSNFLYVEQDGNRFKISIQNFFQQTGLSEAQGDLFDFTGTSIDDEIIEF